MFYDRSDSVSLATELAANQRQQAIVFVIICETSVIMIDYFGHQPAAKQRFCKTALLCTLACVRACVCVCECACMREGM